MTDEEAQQALDQQLPVMWRMAGRWFGPTLLSLLSHWSLRDTWRVECDNYSQWVTAANLRLATAHELLTADEGAQ